jgi:hypothetical protein
MAARSLHVRLHRLAPWPRDSKMAVTNASLVNNFTTPFFTDTLAVGLLNHTSTVAVVL